MLGPSTLHLLTPSPTPPVREFISLHILPAVIHPLVDSSFEPRFALPITRSHFIILGRTHSMSASPSPFTYRRRLGRAPSPPTWAWYEQIPIEDDDSESDLVEEDSCSEDDEEYVHGEQEPEQDRSSESSAEELVSPTLNAVHIGGGSVDGQTAENSEGEEGEQQAAESRADADSMDVEGCDGHDRKDLKGKQRAVDPDAQETPRRRERRKKHREPVFTFRPILTIQRSQGFVWNQVRTFTILCISSISF